MITNKEGIGIYLTRSPVLYPKGTLNDTCYKQVYVYGFKPDALQFYCEDGFRYRKAKLEAIEDMEILHFIYFFEVAGQITGEQRGAVK